MKKVTDNLEKFIHQNKDELKSSWDVPDQDLLWDKISKKLDQGLNKPKLRSITVPLRTVYQMAASLVLVSSLGLYLYFNNYLSYGSSNYQASLNNQKWEQAAPELAEAEKYYTQMISNKQREIAANTPEDMPIDKEYTKAINGLDSMYIILKKEFFNTTAKEKIVEAMVENLKTRIEILNRQLYILERIQQYKDGKEKNNYEKSI